MSKATSVVLALAIILSGLGLFLYERSRPIDELNTYVPAGYSFNRPTDILPQDKLLSFEQAASGSALSGRIEHAIISADPMSGSFSCKIPTSTSTYEPVRTEYFMYAPGRTYGIIPVTGGWKERYAVACGQNYFIIDAADNFGFKMYGPFEIGGK